MPKPEPRPLRTLPERAFRARARLVAALLCCVCFAGLAARLAYLQLFTGSWYTSRALGQQLRDTVVPADRGRIYSADGALLAANSSCWTLRASPREMPEEKLRLAADGLASSGKSYYDWQSLFAELVFFLLRKYLCSRKLPFLTGLLQNDVSESANSQKCIWSSGIPPLLELSSILCQLLRI